MTDTTSIKHPASLTSGDFTAAEEPFALFAEWFAEAAKSEPNDPNAMALATVDGAGQPSVRIVLLKDVDERGLTFYTNYESRKGRELERNPYAAAAFFWPGLERQVRIEGRVERAPAADSDRYFAGRDRESQLGAWASAQSRPIATRDELEAALAAERERWSGRAVERPPHWGMLYLAAESVELWVSGASRLHDRFLFERSAANWRMTRLSP